MDSAKQNKHTESGNHHLHLRYNHQKHQYQKEHMSVISKWKKLPFQLAKGTPRDWDSQPGRPHHVWKRENLESVSHFDPSSITTYAPHMTLLYQQHEKTPPPLERGSYLKAHCPNIYHFCQKHLRGGRRVWMTMWQKSILIERRIKRCWNFCVFSMFV